MKGYDLHIRPGDLNELDNIADLAKKFGFEGICLAYPLGPDFKEFKERIENLQAEREGYVQSLLKEMEETESKLSRGEMNSSELRRNLAREEEKEQQLLTFLELTDDSTKVADQIKEGMADSKERQNEIKAEIVKQTELLERLKSEVTTLRSKSDREKNQETKGIKNLKRNLDQINKNIVLKEEEIQVGMEMKAVVNELPNGQLNYVFQKA